MKVALLGGSFDPPHLGHIQIAQQLTQSGLEDQVWFVPCANHPFDKKMSPAANRLKMLELATNLPIYQHELNKTSTSYTIQTLEAATIEFPDITFSWVMGSDQLPKFTDWHRFQDILDNFPVYVYPRKDFPLSPLQPNMIPLTNFPEVDISSTQIRDNRDSLDSWPNIDPKVKKYIQDKGLYQ